jgi:quercetin dioxygenase-like cupin family protein
MNGDTVQMSSMPPTLRKIEAVERELLSYPQVAMPLQHLFAPGVYLRVIDMPKGTFVIGHEHTTEHFNIVLSGRANVMVDGIVTEIKAPAVFVSKAGVRKVLEILEDMKWATIHPTAGIEACGRNVEQLEAALCVKSETFRWHEKAQGEIPA